MFVTFDSEILSRAPAITVPRTQAPATAREHHVRLRPGQFLFHQGDEAGTIYRVAEGVVRLARVTERATSRSSPSKARLGESTSWGFRSGASGTPIATR